MPGCTSHGCFIKKPTGQGTNGPCHCLRPLGKENELAIKRKIAIKNRALKEALLRFKDYEMEYTETPPKHHKDFMALIQEALEA